VVTGAGSGTVTPVWVAVGVAVLGVLGLVVTAALTASATRRRERDGRRAEHDREALDALVHAAIALRDLLSTNRSGRSRSRSQGADAAHALFAVRREAVRSARVRAAAAAWEGTAQETFNDGPGAKDDEVRCWSAMLRAIGETLRESS
jgi:hypothetical protein